ncbi:MAG: tripartite tricarboxylate transporter permease [Candidatus Micrarchaeota archaeon]
MVAQLGLGILLGILSGLLPGLHSNTVISVISSLGVDKQALSIIIISLFPANLITSFIPSIFFGIPEAGTIVAILPGQRMVRKGLGIHALKTVMISCVFAVLISIVVFYFSLDLFPVIYGMIRAHMRYILLAISLILLLRSKAPHLSLIIFLLSGALGYYSLNSDMSDPFLPMFSGMFAIAAILNYSKSIFPKQIDEPVKVDFLKFTLIGVFLGFIADLIPGVGSPAQIATFLSIFMPLNTLGYLAAISSVSISQAIFSLATAVSINKSRVGATAWLSGNINIESNLVLLLILFLISSSATVFIIFIFRKKIAKLASLDFSKMNIILAIYLIAITFVINGFEGVFILIIGSGVGLLTIKLGVERITLMGAIIAPTLLLLFGIG